MVNHVVCVVLNSLRVVGEFFVRERGPKEGKSKGSRGYGGQTEYPK
tara:strand:- start:323 stop:460 length:138 start_codon:yes stop_codon:yes gene_type:complete